MIDKEGTMSDDALAVLCIFIVLDTVNLYRYPSSDYDMFKMLNKSEFMKNRRNEKLHIQP